MKAEIAGDKEEHELTAVSCEQSDNWLPFNDMDIGIGTRKALAKTSSVDRKRESLVGIRKCLKMVVTYMKDHAPMDSILLKRPAMYLSVSKKGKKRTGLKSKQLPDM